MFSHRGDDRNSTVLCLQRLGMMEVREEKYNIQILYAHSVHVLAREKLTDEGSVAGH